MYDCFVGSELIYNKLLDVFQRVVTQVLGNPHCSLRAWLWRKWMGEDWATCLGSCYSMFTHGSSHPHVRVWRVLLKETVWKPVQWVILAPPGRLKKQHLWFPEYRCLRLLEREMAARFSHGKMDRRAVCTPRLQGTAPGGTTPHLSPGFDSLPSSQGHSQFFLLSHLHSHILSRQTKQVPRSLQEVCADPTSHLLPSDDVGGSLGPSLKNAMHLRLYKWPSFVLFYGWLIFHDIYVPHLLYPFFCQWTFRLLPCLCYCKQCWNEYWGACVKQIASGNLLYNRDLNAVLCADLEGWAGEVGGRSQREEMYGCIQLTHLTYSRNWHSVVKQLYPG